MADVAIATLVSGIHGRLVERVNPERRKHAVGYFPTTMEILGVAVPDIRRAVRPALRALRGRTVDDVLATAHALIATGTHEGRPLSWALRSLTHHGAADVELSDSSWGDAPSRGGARGEQ